MREPTPSDPNVLKAQADRHTASLATQRMDYTIWKHGKDVHDIQDGEFIVGDRVTVVNSLSLAVTTAKLLLRRDPTIAFIDLVPKQPSIFCKRVRVRPPRVVGASRSQIDPTEGIDQYKGVG